MAKGKLDKTAKKNLVSLSITSLVGLVLVIGGFFLKSSNFSFNNHTKAAAPETPIFVDTFENLNGWTVTSQNHTSTAAIVNDSTDPTRGNMLFTQYKGKPDVLQVTKDITIYSNDIRYPNQEYQIEYWDYADRDSGADFYLYDKNSNQYIMLYADNVGGSYKFRNGNTVFDTGIKRTTGWHKFSLFTTKIGSYGAIDGQSLVYLRAKITSPENSTNFPINYAMTKATSVGIEYPNWSKPALQNYWDNFKIITFHNTVYSLSQKQEFLISDFINKYDSIIWTPDFQRFRRDNKQWQDFQIARLGSAAAYGVRYKLQGIPTDLSKMVQIMNEVLDDYGPGWSAQSYGAPISGQTIVQLAAWQWNNFPKVTGGTDLQTKIINITPQIAEIAYNQNPYAPNNPGDSKAEEFAWFSSMLGLTSSFMPNHPRAAAWEARGRIFACTATSSKTTNATYPCENNTQALSPTFTMMNHGINNNASYGLTLPWGLAQGVLFKLNQNLPLPFEYTKNLVSMYNATIKPLTRTRNYTFKFPNPQTDMEKLVAATGRDDWGWDGTPQDLGWAYLDKIQGNTNFDLTNAVTNYEWLSRANGTSFQSLSFTNFTGNWSTTSPQIVTTPDRAFMLNGIDAVDRFTSLFITSPTEYRLQNLPEVNPTQAPAPTTAPIPTAIPTSIPLPTPIPTAVPTQVPAPTTIPIPTAQSDNFNSGLSQWNYPAAYVTTIYDEPVHQYDLTVNYPGNNQYLSIWKAIPNALGTWRSVKYEIEFWDDPGRPYGTGFYVLDPAGNYAMLYVKSGLNTYRVRNNATEYDTGITRSPGWHRIGILVTSSGAKTILDGVNTSAPVFSALVSTTKVVIEYPSWSLGGSTSYWDNFSATPY